MFTEFIILAVWLVSLLVATYVGYDRGRWWEGLLMGLLLGPVGVLAAGRLQPSIAVVADRQWLLAREMEARRKVAQEEARRRQVDRQSMEAWMTDVEQVVLREEATFAEGLDELSAELTALETQGQPDDARRIRAWSRWLKDKAHALRATPRDAYETPPPPGL